MPSAAAHRRRSARRSAGRSNCSVRPRQGTSTAGQHARLAIAQIVGRQHAAHALRHRRRCSPRSRPRRNRASRPAPAAPGSRAACRAGNSSGRPDRAASAAARRADRCARFRDISAGSRRDRDLQRRVPVLRQATLGQRDRRARRSRRAASRPQRPCISRIARDRRGDRRTRAAHGCWRRPRPRGQPNRSAAISPVSLKRVGIERGRRGRPEIDRLGARLAGAMDQRVADAAKPGIPRLDRARAPARSRPPHRSHCRRHRAPRRRPRRRSLHCETTMPRRPEAAGLVRCQFCVTWEAGVKSMLRSGPHANFGGIIGNTGRTVAAIDVQDLPCHPIAFIGGKIECGAGYGLHSTVGVRGNAIEICPAFVSARVG